MSLIVRGIISLILTLAIAVGLKKIKMHIGWKIVILVYCYVIIFVILLYVLFENWFVSFQTPQSVCEYTLGKPITIIEGKNSAYMRTTYFGEFTLKETDGWKIKHLIGPHVKKEKYISMDEGYIVKIVKVEETGELYIFATGKIAKEEAGKIKIVNGIEKIEDNIGTEFKQVINHEMNHIQYIGYLEHEEEDYVLTINGKEIKVDLQIE